MGCTKNMASSSHSCNSMLKCMIGALIALELIMAFIYHSNVQSYLAIPQFWKDSAPKMTSIPLSQKDKVIDISQSQKDDVPKLTMIPQFDSIPCGHPCTSVARRFPRAVIIGVRKAGTRALIDMLSTHPSIASPQPEINFFNRHYSKGLNWYIKQMPCTTPDKITIEKSPNMFHEASKRTPSIVAATGGKWLQLILIVRDPIQRAISEYVNMRVTDNPATRAKRPKGSFEECVLYKGKVNTHVQPILCSMYDVYLEKWLKHVKIEQILVVSGDRLIDNPVPELQKVEKFLGVSPFFTEDLFYKNQTKGFYCWKRTNDGGDEVPYCLDSKKGRKHPTVNNQTIAKLKAFFKAHNENFYSLVGEDFGW